MSKELSTKTSVQDQGDLILRRKYPEMDDDTFYSFKLICQAKGLNPHCDQIYAVPRKNYKTGKTTWTFQTSIEGYRLIADRSGKYAPGREPTFNYDKDGKLISATSYVKKMTADGTWHEVAATAFFDEYAQSYKKDGKEVLNEFWSGMPHGQIAKCAESLAIRKGFPFETANIHTREEMQNTKMSNVLQDVHAEMEDDKKPIDDLIVACSSFETDSISLLECIEERRGTFTMEKYAARCLKDVEKFKEFYLTWKKEQKKEIEIESS